MPRLPVNRVRLHVEIAGEGPPLVLLHGFTGDSRSWAPHVAALAPRYRVVAVDLLGHARSDAPADHRRYSVEHGVADLRAVFDRLGLSGPCVLGYSMGGRVALALAAAGGLRGLVLVSASPGVRDPAERRARARQDGLLAAAIERDGVPAFVERWERLPMFATQAALPAVVQAQVRATRLQHTARGLANSLRGMGQGVQPPLYERLRSLRVPTLLVVGALDAAYCALGLEMSRQIPDARLTVVPGAGHAVHLEQPEAFRRSVLQFLEEVTADYTAR